MNFGVNGVIFWVRINFFGGMKDELLGEWGNFRVKSNFGGGVNLG